MDPGQPNLGRLLGGGRDGYREISLSLLLGTVLGASFTRSCLIPAHIFWGICVLFSSRETEAQKTERSTNWISVECVLGELLWEGLGGFPLPEEGSDSKGALKAKPGLWCFEV